MHVDFLGHVRIICIVYSVTGFMNGTMLYCCFMHYDIIIVIVIVIHDRHTTTMCTAKLRKTTKLYSVGQKYASIGLSFRYKVIENNNKFLIRSPKFAKKTDR